MICRRRTIPSAVAGSMTKSMRRRLPTSRAVYWRIAPRASSVLIAGSVTIPIGTPMTPSGICRTVNAIV